MSNSIAESVQGWVAQGGAGEDPSSTDAYYELEELHEQSEFDEESGTFRKDWKGIVATGVSLTQDVGVHLRVLAHTGEAVVWTLGYAGVADACRAFAVALGDGWDHVHPRRAGGRRGATHQFVRKLESWIGHRQHLPEAGEGLEAAADAVRAFSDVIEQRFEDIPSVPDTLAVLEILVAEARESTPAPAASSVSSPAPPPQDPSEPRPEPAPEEPVPEEPAPEERAPATPASAPPRQAARPTRVAPPADSATPAGIVESLGRERTAVLGLVDRWRALEPSRPEPHRLSRDLRWAVLAAPPRDRLTVPRVPDAGRLQGLARNKDWKGLLGAAESSWTRFLFWLTPHWHIGTALAQLGHTEAAEAVRSTTADFLERLPGLAEVSYVCELPGPRPDGTMGRPDPVAAVDPATRAWLQRGAPSKESAGAVDDAVPEDAAGVDGLLRRTASPRDRAVLLWRYARSRLDQGEAADALPILLGLEAELGENALERWDTALAADVLAALWEARAADGAEPEVLRELAVRAARFGRIVGSS